MWWDGWPAIGRVLLTGLVAYVGLVAVLRVTGKRTLTKLNAFDLVVTVALGSTLAATVLDSAVTVSEGLAGLALLILLQYVFTWLSVRSPRFQELIKAQPALLVRHGRFLEGAMRRERVSREEILAAVRSSGIGRVEAVAAVVLETDGSISVLQDLDGGIPDAAALEPLPRTDDGPGRSSPTRGGG